MIDNPNVDKESLGTRGWSAWHRYAASGGMDASAGLQMVATIVVIVGSALVLVFGIAGDRYESIGLVVAVAGSATALLIHRFTGRVGLALDFMVAGVFAAVCLATYFSGGLAERPPYWFVAMPMIASVFGFRRRATFWIIASCVFVLALYLMELGGYALPPSELTPQAELTEQMILLIVFLVAAFVLYAMNDASRRRAILELNSANEELSATERASYALREQLEDRVKDRTCELRDAQQNLTKNLVDARRAGQLVKLGTYEWDWPEDRLVACSEEYARIHEMSVAEALQTFTSLEADYNYIHPDDREGIAALEAEMVVKREGYSAAYRMLSPSGHICHVQEVCEVELNDQGEVIRTLGSLQDISEQVELEERLRQAQKMEAVGTLAGGIAHDFNNLLTGINGHSDMILESLKPDDPLHQGLSEIAKAGNRAATLTRQLLAFSRKQVLQPKVINMGEIVVEMEDMLRRLIGEHIELDVRRDPDLQRVKADPGQIEQLIMNLVVNARDAMPQGGSITVSVENVALDHRASAALGGLSAGSYVMLSVCDTGCGMDEETLIHVFEPFYTTKKAEKGTGLGLSTVFGIIKQSGGGIEVESEPDKGSTFRIYLPQVEASEPIAEEKEHFAGSGEGHETILVVEDEEMIRALLKRILERLGYTVLSARHGEEALLTAKRHRGPIELMITDVVMPQMSGHELAKQLAPLRPEMSVLYISGYDEKMVADQGLVDPKRHFLQKPFLPKDVAGKIRKILDKEISPPTKDDRTVNVLSGIKAANT